ncbi:MAG: hypothetical protein U1E46_07975 [Hyphomicrobiales bacterium]
MRVLVALLAFLLVGPNAASAAPADDAAALEALFNAIDASGDWRASAQTIAETSDGATASGVSIAREDGSLAFTADKLTARDLAMASDGSLHAGDVRLETAAVATALQTISAPSFEARDLTVPSFTGWKPDPEKPGRSAGAFLTLLAKVAFANVSAPTVSVVTRPLSIDGEQTAADALADKTLLSAVEAGAMANGVLSSARAGTISATTAGTAPSATMLAGVEASGIDIAAFAAAWDAAATPPEGWRPALARVTVKGLDQTSATDPEASTTYTKTKIAEIALRDVSVRRGSKSVGDLYDEVVALAQTTDISSSSVFSKLFPSTLAWIRLGSLAVSGVELANDAGTDKLTLEQMAMNDLSTDRLGLGELKALALSGEGLELKFGRFALEGVTWPSAEAWAAVAAVEEKQAAGAVDEATLDEAAANLLAVYPTIAKTSIEGVSLMLGAGDPITLDALVLADATDAATDVNQTDNRLDRLVIPATVADAMPDVSQMMRALGYQAIDLSGASKGRHDRKGGDYTNASALSLKDAGTLTLDYALKGLTTEVLTRMAKPFLKSESTGSTDDAALATALDAAKLTGLTLRYADQGFVRRWISWSAQQQGIDEAQLAQNLADAGADLVRDAGDAAIISNVKAALNAFFLDPKSLTVTLAPAEPLGLGRLMETSRNPQIGLSGLGLNIRAND